MALFIVLQAVKANYLLRFRLYIGITGWVCDERRGADLNSLLKFIPKDRLIIETDAPYLIPRNLKSKTKHNINTPMNLLILQNILLMFVVKMLLKLLNILLKILRIYLLCSLRFLVINILKGTLQRR